MIENGRMTGLGLAVVDYKVKRNDSLKLPDKRELLVPFLNREIIEAGRTYFVCAGGSIANALSSFVTLAGDRSFKLFCAISNDTRGLIYAQNTNPQLGRPQIYEEGETGLWIALLDEMGNPEGLSYHGIGDQTRVSRTELSEVRNELFITDITSCKDPLILDRLDPILKSIREDGGNFALSLGGTRPNGLAKEKLSSLLSSFSPPPDMVFGNEQEFFYATQVPNINLGLSQSFPKTRLLVVTLGDQGSVVRFESTKLFIPAIKIPAMDIVDQTGAGDAYMGTMLAYLYTLPYRRWNVSHVQKAAYAASRAGALIIQTMESRITDKTTETIKNAFTQTTDP